MASCFEHGVRRLREGTEAGKQGILSGLNGRIIQGKLEIYRKLCLRRYTQNPFGVTEITQVDDKIHVRFLRRAEEGVHPLYAVVHNVQVQVSKGGKSYSLFVHWCKTS